MGCTSEIRMWFSKEKHARWAMHVAEEMIKLLYAQLDRDEPAWVTQAKKCPTLSGRYLDFRHEAAAYPLDPEYTALQWLCRSRTILRIDRCQDICGWTGIEDPEALVPQLFYAYGLRFPQVPFTALYRHEMTVSGAILLIRAQYDGEVMHMQEKTGERPMDEDDWIGETIYDYVALGGTFIRKEPHAPM